MDQQLDEFVTDVAGCGLFQVLLTMCTYGVKVAGGWSTLFMSFGSYNPGLTCHLDIDSYNDTSSTPATTPAPQRFSGTTSSILYLATSDVTQAYGSNESSIPGTCDVLPLCTNTTYNPDASTIVTEFDLKCGDSGFVSHIISIQMVGVAVGSYLSGEIGDRWGRRVSMFAWLALSGVSNFAAIFAPSWEVYAAIRFVIGMSAGGCVALSLYYPLEFVTSGWRVAVAGFPSWDIGLTVYGLLMLALHDWKLIHASTVILSGIALLTTIWMPESMRWLMVHRKSEQAGAVAKRMCRYNKKPFPQHLSLFLKTEADKPKESKPGMLLLFNRTMRKVTILSFIIYFNLSVMYMAIAFGLSALFGNFYVNFIAFALLSVPAAPLVPLLGNKVGRKRGTMLLLMISGLVGLSIVVIFFTGSSYAYKTTITVLALCISTLVDQAWALETAHTAELYPTEVRALGLGFASTGARFGGIVAPYLVPRDPNMLYISYLIMTGLVGLNCLMLAALPETRGNVMPDEIARQNQVLVVVTDVPEENGNEEKRKLTTGTNGQDKDPGMRDDINRGDNGRPLIDQNPKQMQGIC